VIDRSVTACVAILVIHGCFVVVMSMRKCCNHPYLFDNAEPTFDGEYVLGEHLVQARYRFVATKRIAAAIDSGRLVGGWVGRLTD
jgi:hypothetical protein